MYYSRFLLLALFCLIVSACSRDYNVSVPPQEVQQDVDCGFGELVTPVFRSVEVFSDVPGGERVTLFSGTDITDLSVEVEGAATSGTFKLALDPVAEADGVDLDSGMEAVVEELSIDAFFPNQDDGVTVGLDDPFSIAVKDGLEAMRLVGELTIKVTETREPCFFLATQVDEDDENSVRTREFNVEAVVSFSFSRKTVNEASIPALHFSVSDGDFGSSVAVSQNYLAVGEPGNSNEYTTLNDVTVGSLSNSGAVHIYEKVTSDQWTLCTILKASNARAGDGFGSALAWSENQLIVGSPFEDRAGGGVYLGTAADQALAYSKPDSGAVYVFANELADGCDFQEVAYIKNPDNPTTMTFTNAGFGSALATYRGELLVGAPRQQDTSISSVDARIGKAYLYKKNGLGNFAATVTFNSGVKHDSEEFGSSVALDERLLVIGAPGDSVLLSNVDSFAGVVEGAELENGTLTPLSSESGAAHVYLRDDEESAFTFYAYLKPANNEDNDRVGQAVAVFGTSVFVGAPNEDSVSNQANTGESDNSRPNSGAVYHYLLSDGDSMALRNYLKPSDTQSSMNFGAKLDVNTELLAVSAPGYLSSDSDGDTRGRVSTFDFLKEARSVSTVFNDVQTSTSFERSGVGLDLYGSILAVGAPGARDNSAQAVGAVFVLD